MKQVLFLICALAALLLGGLGVVNELRILQRAHASASWPVVEGVFQTVTVNTNGPRSTPCKWLEVHYAYEINGVRYSSHHLWPPGTHSGMSGARLIGWRRSGPLGAQLSSVMTLLTMPPAQSSRPSSGDDRHTSACSGSVCRRRGDAVPGMAAQGQTTAQHLASSDCTFTQPESCPA